MSESQELSIFDNLGNKNLTKPAKRRSAVIMSVEKGKEFAQKMKK